MELSTPKTEGKLHHARSAWCISFPSVFGVDTSINPKNITTIPYHFISTLLYANFDFDVSVANDVAIDVAKCALPGKVMQWSPCPEVRTLTNENGRYIMKLNDYNFGWELTTEIVINDRNCNKLFLFHFRLPNCNGNGIYQPKLWSLTRKNSQLSSFWKRLINRNWNKLFITISVENWQPKL